MLHFLFYILLSNLNESIFEAIQLEINLHFRDVSLNFADKLADLAL